MASEAGRICRCRRKDRPKWRLQPGKMLLIDMEEGRIISDEEIKRRACHQASLSGVAGPHPAHPRGPAAGGSRAAALARTSRCSTASRPLATPRKTLKILMAPMATTGQEAIGSMGTDTPISALSDKSKLLYTYFKQNFAQVTNPPIDPIREELVMSLVSFIGPRPNLFDLKGLSRSASGSKCASRS
jgi:glutamate synthase (NADPH/NADH) large chain